MRNLMIAASAAMLLAACSGMYDGGVDGGGRAAGSGGSGSSISGGGTSGSQGVDEPNVSPNATSSSPGPYSGSGVSEPQSRSQSFPNRSGSGW
ncbi:hypothetical protein [Roseomonas genomospecies 6]|uniref:Lipoprotein n=1 Tax=Roseomonas genomospecies 6 TaxID=214106 RepID=A0A9W7TVA7_9PROT|nr:hypothetical protein [Roseomonas genomospecies 6]KAA0679018.1 hypothetical protein DS843_18065 [Roseomonas genomospecies 6]